MTKDEALRMALEELKHIKDWCLRRTGIGLVDENVLAKVEEALANHIEDNLTMVAQPEQEKERCVGCEAYIDTACGRDECPKGWPKAPQRTWVGLTDKEAHELWESTDSDDDWELMKRTEAKLKEKNL